MKKTGEINVLCGGGELAIEKNERSRLHVVLFN